jgi:hypothetical protein
MVYLKLKISIWHISVFTIKNYKTKITSDSSNQLNKPHVSFGLSEVHRAWQHLREYYTASYRQANHY